MGNRISEAQTRRDIIDKRLKKAGWDVNEPTQVTTELDIWVGLPEDITEPPTRGDFGEDREAGGRDYGGGEGAEGDESSTECK